MANWKKIIVSGSQAILANVKADNLTAGTVLIGGTSGLIQNSGITFASSTYSFGATSLVATGASSALTGSFTGSFAGEHTGDGSGLTGIALDIDALANTGMSNTSLVDGDLFVVSDGGTEKKITYGQLYKNIFDEVAGDVTISAAGASVIGAGAVEGTMLNTNVADTTTIEVSSNTLSVLKVPNALSAGAGLTAPGTFDGANSGIFSVDSGSLLPYITGSTFGTVTGDVTISAAGVATIGANKVDGSKLTDSITIAQDLTVTGDLIVNGDTTTVNTANLQVEDKFIFVNAGSGSVSPVGEGGIIVESGSAGSGSAFYFDGNADRWSLANNLGKEATTATPEAYAAVVVDIDASMTADVYEQVGNIKHEGGDIYIWA